MKQYTPSFPTCKLRFPKRFVRHVKRFPSDLMSMVLYFSGYIYDGCEIPCFSVRTPKYNNNNNNNKNAYSNSYNNCTCFEFTMGFIDDGNRHVCTIIIVEVGKI